MGAKAPPGDRPANIHDVAALCGVAPSTVSRALTNPGRISDSTRKRVQEAASQLGYVPSRQARALSSGRTGTIAVLVPDISDPAYLAPLKGIHSELKAAGYAQLLVDTETDPDVEATALEQLRKGTDGVIVAPSLLSDADLIAAAGRQPLVAINRDLPGVPATVIDPEPALTEMLDMLVRAGHQSVAYVGSAAAAPPAAAAEAMTLRRAAAAHGLSLAPAGSFPPAVDAGTGAADAVMATGATACIAASSLLALGMLQRFRESGLDVPAAMPLIAYEDYPGSEFWNPSLTTLSPPLQEAGRTAAAMLVAMLRGDENIPGRILLPATVTWRESAPYFVPPLSRQRRGLRTNQ